MKKPPTDTRSGPHCYGQLKDGIDLAIVCVLTVLAIVAGGWVVIMVGGTIAMHYAERWLH